MMNNDVVKKAIEEWMSLGAKDHEAHLAFSRKIHMAEAMGVISRDELRAIKEKIAEIKHENTLKMMRDDVEMLNGKMTHAYYDDAVRRFLGM